MTASYDSAACHVCGLGTPPRRPRGCQGRCAYPGHRIVCPTIRPDASSEGCGRPRGTLPASRGANRFSPRPASRVPGQVCRCGACRHLTHTTANVSPRCPQGRPEGAGVDHEGTQVHNRPRLRRTPRRPTQAVGRGRATWRRLLRSVWPTHRTRRTLGPRT